MTKSHFLSFLCGAAAVFGVMTIGQSKAQAPAHIYELRTYHATPGKLDQLEARFRDHVDGLFRKHDLHVIGYWIPQDNKENVFIYIVEHRNKAEATKNWAAVLGDDDWKKLRAESEASGPLTTRAPESIYMNPTDFSKLK